MTNDPLRTSYIRELLDYKSDRSDEASLSLVQSVLSEAVQHCARNLVSVHVDVAPTLPLDRHLFTLKVRSSDGAVSKATEVSKAELKKSSMGLVFYVGIGSQAHRIQFNSDLNEYIKAHHKAEV